MGVRLISNTYTDIFGNDLSYYQANAGDKVVLTTIIETNIRVVENAGIYINVNFIDGELQLIGGLGWLGEGFRLGDTITLAVYDIDTGTLHSDDDFTIDYIDNEIIRVEETIGDFDHDVYTLVVYVSDRSHDTLELKINHCLNSGNTVLNSLIDGEFTIAKFFELDAMTVTDTVTGDLIGNQSGQYLISSEIERLADSHGSRQYSIVSIFIQSGVYKKEWFELGDALKIAYQFNAYSLPNEIANVTTLNFSESGNTGWFNEAYNVSVVDSTLTTGIDSIDYSVDTTSDIVIETSATEFYIGAQYVSTDPDRYKNKVANQNELSLLLDAYIPLAVGTYSSEGGLYEITVNSITTVATTHTINITFSPLTGFDTLFDSFDEGDRLFYIWVKAGNINHLVFGDQLTKTIENIQPLSPVRYRWLLHDVNTTEFTDGISDLEKSNTEDNLAWIAHFPMTPNVIYTGVRLSIIACNSVTEDSFDLETMLFSLASTQINGSGQYLLNVSQSVSNNLPSTSVKKTALLSLDTTNDTAEIYYPFLNRWQYWENQTNADPFFYPDQNKNWINYISGDWTTKILLSLETSDVLYQNSVDLPISEYDTEPLIVTEIELFREGDDPLVDTSVTAFFSGEVMKIKVTHTYTGWDAQSSWGEITIEGFESQPRWLVSSEIDHDNNPNNPLSPVTGTTITKTDGSSVTTLICNLDVDKLTNLDSKITSKIYLKVVEAVGLVFQDETAIETQDINYLDTQGEL